MDAACMQGMVLIRTANGERDVRSGTQLSLKHGLVWSRGSPTCSLSQP
jgi:hypothetical protein